MGMNAIKKGKNIEEGERIVRQYSWTGHKKGWP